LKLWLKYVGKIFDQIKEPVPGKLLAGIKLFDSLYYILSAYDKTHAIYSL